MWHSAHLSLYGTTRDASTSHFSCRYWENGMQCIHDHRKAATIIGEPYFNKMGKTQTLPRLLGETRVVATELSLTAQDTTGREEFLACGWCFERRRSAVDTSEIDEQSNKSWGMRSATGRNEMGKCSTPTSTAAEGM